jgi:sensor histidine kinase regulating citrate/malate metabolism
VLGNVLGNAIEACDRITDALLIKKIDIEMKYYNGSICLHEKNTYNIDTVKQSNGRFLSSKGYREGNSIGIGLGNIQSTVDMYDGVFHVELNDTIFNLKIMIQDKIIPIS